MTKQEKIRERIVEEIKKWHYLSPLAFGQQADRILSYLHSQGVVIKGQSLGASHPHLAAYYIVEPLIEEE